VCKKIIQGADYVDAHALIPALEIAVATAGVTGQAALKSAQEVLRGVDAATAIALAKANSTLQEIQKTGDKDLVNFKAILAKAMQDGLAVVQRAQQDLDDVVKGVEWIAYQTAQVGLKAIQDLAQAEISVAEKAVEAAKLVEDGAIDLAKVAVQATGLLEVREVQLTATLQKFSQEKKFDASISLEIEGKPIGPLKIGFDLHSPEDIVKEVLKSLVDSLKKKI
jgi:hypothetical protein